MASNIQMVMYEGFLGSDPELRYTPQGKSVVNFRMGSNRQYKNAEGEVVKETTWLKITAWGNLAEIVSKYCEKGSHVIVTGVLRVGENGSPEVYQKNDGTYGASFEITAREVRILKGKTVAETSSEKEEVDENIPF